MASRTNAAQELSRRGQHFKEQNNFSSEMISSINKLLRFSATEFSVISLVRQIQAYQKTGSVLNGCILQNHFPTILAS